MKNEITSMQNFPIDIEGNAELVAVEVMVDSIKLVVDSIVEMSINKQIEETKRETIRAQARVAIALIESENRVRLSEIKYSHVERMRVIDMLDNFLRTQNDKSMPELTEFCVALLKNVNFGARAIEE